MIGVFTTDDDRLGRLPLHLPVCPDKADIRVVGLGPRTGEENVIQITRSQFRDLAGQCDCRHMCRLKKRVVVRQFAHLPRRNFGKVVASVADVHAPQTRHAVDDLVAFAVCDPHALGTGNHARPFFGKFRARCEWVHMMRGVQRLKLRRWHMVGNRRHPRFS